MLHELIHDKTQALRVSLFIHKGYLVYPSLSFPFSSKQDQMLSGLCSEWCHPISSVGFASILAWNSFWSSKSTPSELYIKICSTGELSKFLACVYSLAYDEKPKYQVLKKILLDGLESSGIRYDGPLEFSAAACTRNHSAPKVSKVRQAGLGLFLTSPVWLLPFLL